MVASASRPDPPPVAAVPPTPRLPDPGAAGGWTGPASGALTDLAGLATAPHPARAAATTTAGNHIARIAVPPGMNSSPRLRATAPRGSCHTPAKARRARLRIPWEGLTAE